MYGLINLMRGFFGREAMLSEVYFKDMDTDSSVLRTFCYLRRIEREI